MNNAEYIAQFLRSRGITHVFELTGGMITFLLDALSSVDGIRIVSMHHEQGAAFAAEGWARSNGLPGVAMATSGPGATNLLTGIGSCYFDSVPAVFITGQVNTHEQKSRTDVRQQGFQETSIVEMVHPITKAAWQLNDAKDVPVYLEKAFELAMEGRPGPVLLDIPMDVQRATVTVPPPSKCAGDGDARCFEEVDVYIDRFLTALGLSKNPLILAGGGLRSARAISSFRSFVERVSMPVVHSLMGVDALSGQSEYHVGLIGSYGNRWANLALSEADLVLVLGSRLDIRQTGSDISSFRRAKQIFHVDCIRGETNNRVTECDCLVSDLAHFLPRLLAKVPDKVGFREHWMREIATLKSRYPATKEVVVEGSISPISTLEALYQRAQSYATIVTDVGQHQMWAAQTAALGPHQRFLTSGGMGAMGFALPAGIGAAFASGPTVVVAGDGGFQLNIQELQTVVRNKLPIKILILNNRCHGMVRQFQESYFKARYQSTVWGYSAPSFTAVANAYGLVAKCIAKPEEVGPALDELLATPTCPQLLEVMIGGGVNVYPKLAFGKPFGQMEPDSQPLEMEGT